MNKPTDDDIYDAREAERADWEAAQEADQEEPDEEDIFCSDSDGPYHYQQREIASTPAELTAWMEKEGYFPNVWVISDHGNAHLVSVLPSGQYRFQEGMEDDINF